MGQKRSLFKRDSFIITRQKYEMLEMAKEYLKELKKNGPLLVVYLIWYFGSIDFVPRSVPEAHLMLTRGSKCLP